MSKRNTALLGIAVFLILSGWGLWIHARLQAEAETNKLREEMRMIRDTETATEKKYQRTKAYSDSTEAENVKLFKQKQLTAMMSYRDSVAALTGAPLPGDLVTVAPRGDTALVTEIVAGGNGYNNYLMCRIRYKDKSHEDVAPILLKKIQQ